ncbi:MAG TPA: hypothetical protein VJP86_02550 [Vicinamibacterales bacterium]|jgi:hypothetical protein|nr:hypothetical protein [Vicinamibacterales bacterium]
MWNWFNCYLSGRHDYGMWCEPGTIFLRCIHCGRRSSGWHLHETPEPVKSVAAVKAAPAPAAVVAIAAQLPRAAVIPFKRPAVS